VNVRTLRVVLCTALAASLLVLATGCFLLPNRAPVASFVIHYDIEADPMIVELDAQSSSDPDGDAITTYMWTFGSDDVVIPEPLASSKTVNTPVLLARYPFEGTYAVQLLVIDARGLASEVAHGTVVLPNPQVGPTP